MKTFLTILYSIQIAWALIAILTYIFTGEIHWKNYQLLLILSALLCEANMNDLQKRKRK